MRTNPSWVPGNLESSGKLREGDIIDRNNWAQVLRETPDKVADIRLHRLNQIYKNYKQDGKTDYNTSLQFVKEAYTFKPLDPYNPAKPFPRELRNAVGMILGLQESKQMMRIKFYSAIDSPLDRHGRDAVIEYDDPDVGIIDITLDETIKRILLCTTKLQRLQKIMMNFCALLRRGRLRL